jgi:cystathionine beta-lyase
MNKDSISYILNHLGEEDHPHGVMSPPIYQTSNFSFKDFDALQTAINDELSHSLYTRGNNPTVMLVEKKLAALEGAERAKLVSSGSSAISLSLMAFVRSGDHIVSVKDCYVWAHNLIGRYLPRFGVEHTFVEGTFVYEVIKAIRPNTKVIYLESPTSLSFKLQNLEAIAVEARKRGIKTIVDNTWASPLHCNPIEHGIDIVIHSGSKYLGGSSDIVAGVIMGTREDIDFIQEQEFLQFGTVPDPFMAWLLLRGLRTLPIRLKTHSDNAMAVANYLENHPKVEGVIHPMLPSYPQHELAKKLFRGGSGVFAFRLKTRKLSDIINLTNETKMFKRAVSWGGFESLILPMAAVYPTEADIPADRFSLIRIFTGLEDSDELIADLDNALKYVGE